MIHKRKGVTLAEMAIVMAVIAIVSLSVVSFVMITSGRGTNSIAKLNAMEEIELVEAVVDGWFAQAVQAGKSIAVNNGDIKADGLSPFETEGKILHVDFPETGRVDYRFEKVTGLRFAIETKTETDELGNEIVLDALYFCTVTYVQEKDAPKQTYTFCINPRVGETIVPELTGATTE